MYGKSWQKKAHLAFEVEVGMITQVDELIWVVSSVLIVSTLPSEVAKIIKAEISSTRMKQNVFPDKDGWSLPFCLSVNQSKSISISMTRKPADERHLLCAL